MDNELSKVLNELVSKLQKTVGMVQPHIVLGDDDSINLTQHQLGFIAGINTAIKLVEQIPTAWGLTLA